MESIKLREQVFEVLKGALRAITISPIFTAISALLLKLQQYHTDVLTGKIRLMLQFRVKSPDSP